MTAHPATIALGLMYMRTGNEAIAKELELPETISMLEEIRPDVIPKIIRDYAQSVLKFPSPIEVDISDKEAAYWDEVVDRETVAEVYLYAMTAACFAMALKYSGTIAETQEQVAKLLEERMQFLMHDFNIESVDWPARHMIRAANRSVVNLCADMMLASMAILNVGHGRVNPIRYARYRRSHDYELSYWSHYQWKYHEEMLYHQPLRFLWAQAIEPRLIVPMCRKKNKPIQCDLRIKFKDPSCFMAFCQAPMMLPPIDDLTSISLCGAGIEEVYFDLTNEDRKRELVEMLTTGHGRVPVTVTESCLDDRELAQQEDWTLRQIFDHRLERPGCKVTKLAKELERMKMPSHPGGHGDLRWRNIDSAPAIRQYLQTLHMVSQPLGVFSQEGEIPDKTTVGRGQMQNMTNLTYLWSCVQIAVKETEARRTHGQNNSVACGRISSLL
ncbi:unnamed protein product [Heligmosomoides polygyrus]|uniref:Anaphase-promoting complex subunit 1 n=1 Tax=Heligmosomoides polygyrus TaxID=6339 RepID=A0A3P8C1A8_HELPZ|nr:unnamed protein product [Heligmosomoides polygyrus]